MFNYRALVALTNRWVIYYGPGYCGYCGPFYPPAMSKNIF